MAVETVSALTELTSPAANDEIGIWDVSAGEYKKIQQSNLVGATITGGGTVALGGYTLTVPATGTVALRGSANTFTATQTISGVPIEMVRSGAELANFRATVGGTLLGQLYTSAISFNGRDMGVGAAGCNVWIGNNSNATQGGAGFVSLFNLAGSNQRIWVDGSGVLRINSADPTYANDTAGTVVGTQTSSLDSKDVIGDPDSIDNVLAAVAAGAAAVRRFTYRSGAFNGEEFSGVVVDYAPRYGMDCDEEHPAGKSLNVVTVIGDLLLAVANLADRVAALEARLA